MAAGDMPADLVDLNPDAEEEPDETLSERLWALSEMFPASIRSATWSLCSGSWGFAQGSFSLARQSAWLFSSSFVIAVLPAIVEIERLDMQQRQMTEQRQFLLGATPQTQGQSTYSTLLSQKTA